MTLLKIARMGHPVLLQAAEAIADPTSRDVGRLLEDMVETIEDASGVGLAAPQVYEGKRVIIFKSPRERGEEDGAETDFSPLTALINPEFETGKRRAGAPMGRMPVHSRNHRRGTSVHADRVSRVSAQRAAGGTRSHEFHARVVQHEIDHLDGVLFPMRMTDLSLLSFNEELKAFMEHATAQAADNDNNGGQDA